MTHQPPGPHPTWAGFSDRPQERQLPGGDPTPVESSGSESSRFARPPPDSGANHLQGDKTQADHTRGNGPTDRRMGRRAFDSSREADADGHRPRQSTDRIVDRIEGTARRPAAGHSARVAADPTRAADGIDLLLPWRIHFPRAWVHRFATTNSGLA